MDMFTTRGSYHSMNDYTSYQTHGRYVAPNKYEVSDGAGHGGQSGILLVADDRFNILRWSLTSVSAFPITLTLNR